MRALPFLIAAGVAALTAGAAHAGATVTYIEPDKFIDVPLSPIDRERVLKELTQHFEQLGKQLPAGQDVKIEVTEVDLAGRIEHTRRTGNEIRLLTGGADWPRMHLRYTLTQDGKVINSGEADLASMNYLSEMNQYGGGESLRHEKHMIDDWFGKTFHVQVKRHV
ncbi:hypothetical protein GCM10027277_43160 [Pseudoduganella ginsengisoli]|uniref:DUF3016 domain-containing protein n=1 Tax=Pseudoduganella ginsengisoli TaxID=1462440 RepID=A0A6L6Q5X7_9BURK|nr:DUF3016 domain-containing protein [Pseudoduganella ginsengisoli]MTW05080.1 DUF3016 domain-containing protein [Pseudoduganella ginsengisoli]